ncbi:MAG: EthD family reductase [Ilumatobacteraceae bacterium]|nr:EthD family reductase [Ilumatobacteraceae bacterium]
MGKRIIFPLRRLGHLTRDEFQAYWRTSHGPLVAHHASTLGIVRYQQVHTLHEARPTKVPCFDGVAELWVDPSRRSTDANAVAAASQALLDDERNFIDHSNSPIWIADEDPMLDGPKIGLRGTAVLRRRDGISREDFKRHWHDIHAPWALGRPDVWGFVRYIQNHTPANADDNPLARERNAPPAFDGLSEIYRVASTAPADEVARLRDELLADEPNFMDVDASPVFMGEVHVIIGEP